VATATAAAENAAASTAALFLWVWVALREALRAFLFCDEVILVVVVELEQQTDGYH
jgi:hypothetical protein